MNKRPVDYKQYDSRWASVKYNGPGETDKTIKSSGCGPTSAAMLIATLADKSVTPVTTCAWSVEHGYKYANQGTAYSYFKPQFANYGIECKQLLSSRIINKPDHEIHDQVKQYLNDGYYIIALMGPGTWTTGGHYVVVWGWDDKVRINDSMSVKDKRLNGDPETFKNEVRMYWLIDARAYNGKTTNGSDEEVTQEQFNEMMTAYLKELGQKDDVAWGGEWTSAKEWAENSGLIKGDANGNKQYQNFTTRQQMVMFLYRLYKKLGG